jgi:hypothetical protein
MLLRSRTTMHNGATTRTNQLANTQLRSGTTLCGGDATEQSNQLINIQLRSGTTLCSEVNWEQQLEPHEFITIANISLRQKMNDQMKHPISSDINNLIYILRLYETFHKHLRRVFDFSNIDIEKRGFYPLIIVSFDHTLDIRCQLIRETYKMKSIEYTDYTKGLIVKLMYKINEMISTLRYVLSQMECQTDCTTELLQISIDKKGEEILDKDSIEAKTYYCYRYLYKSQVENNYNISSYADGKHTEVEIYDYYFKENTSKDEKDDLLIKDYEKWFVFKATTDRYDIVAYDNE